VGLQKKEWDVERVEKGEEHSFKGEGRLLFEKKKGIVGKTEESAFAAERTYALLVGVFVPHHLPIGTDHRRRGGGICM